MDILMTNLGLIPGSMCSQYVWLPGVSPEYRLKNKEVKEMNVGEFSHNSSPKQILVDFSEKGWQLFCIFGFLVATHIASIGV